MSQSQITFIILLGYYESLNGVEETAHVQRFRNNGFPNYLNCKYVFVTCKAALFWGEHQENFWENLPKRDSDSEDEEFMKYEANDMKDEDVDDDDEENLKAARTINFVRRGFLTIKTSITFSGNFFFPCSRTSQQQHSLIQIYFQAPQMRNECNMCISFT